MILTEKNTNPFAKNHIRSSKPLEEIALICGNVGSNSVVPREKRNSRRQTVHPLLNPRQSVLLHRISQSRPARKSHVVRANPAITKQYQAALRIPQNAWQNHPVGRRSHRRVLNDLTRLYSRSDAFSALRKGV